MTVMAGVKRGFGSRQCRSGAQYEARPSIAVGRDHVARRDQQPEQKDEREYRRK